MADADGEVTEVLYESLTWREHDILRLLAERRTNKEIAQTLGIELTTVKWYNKQIYSKLDVTSRYQAVAKARDCGLLEGAPEASAVDKAPAKSNLPVQLTSFVGRERELADVIKLLGEVNLLTLTGPGGTGKTRLALQAAGELLNNFEDGRCFVDLAPIRQAELVADTVAEALGITKASEQSIATDLANYLRSKELLLILDNFEHLMKAAPLVGDLLSAAPRLRVLVTSREALRLYGEQEFPVGPLRLPDLSKPTSLAELMGYEAVALFCQRVRAIKPGFDPSDKDATTLGEICVRLDGLPLAIELAASRVKLFNPRELFEQLDNRFITLQGGPRGVPARQQTLRGTLEWSYDLLDEAEKTLFARLSIFNGGCTLEGVAEVCSQDLSVDMLDGLESLLNKNLLYQTDNFDGTSRFNMLETMREYAGERLLHSDETEDISRRHARYFTSLAERAEPHTRGGPSQMRWFRLIEEEHENFRSMFRWSMDGGDVEFGLRLVGALGFFWWRRGHYAEGKRWMSRALEVSDEASLGVHANFLFAAGLVSRYESDLVTSKRMFLKALVQYKDLGSQRDIGWTLLLTSVLSIGLRGEYEQAVALCEEGLDILRQVDDKPGIAHGFNNLGELARSQGYFSRAKEVYEKALEIAREIGDILREGIQLLNLGFISQADGNPQQAQILFQQTLALAEEIDQISLTTNTLAALAETAEAQDDLKRAALLFGAAEALYAAVGFTPQIGDLPDFEQSRTNTREQLGVAAFEEIWAEGWAMSREKAVAYALKNLDSS